MRIIGKAVLIMAAFFLFSSSDVYSAEENTVETLWSATLTVGELEDEVNSETLYGYNSSTRTGSITDNDFVYNGTTYQVRSILLQEDEDFLRLSIYRRGFSGQGFRVRSNINRTFYLKIGNNTNLDFRDEDQKVAKSGLGQSEQRREWTGQTQDWSVGDRISVSITTRYLDGALKLPTATATSGKLQIFDDSNNDGTGQWERICDDNWDDTDAQVACDQLELSGGTATHGDSGDADLGSVETFLLDEVECEGNENRVIECDHEGRGLHNCAAWEIAGVTCTSP